jgi:hypothetical protein
MFIILKYDWKEELMMDSDEHVCTIVILHVF